MKMLFRMVSTLGLIAALSGFLLAYANQKTSLRIKENQAKEVSQAIFKLIPEGKSYETKSISGYKVYFVKDTSGKLRGACVLTSGNGYQGEIKILIGLSYDFKHLKGIEILDNVETPGLGGEISKKSFRGQFEGLVFPPRIKCVKGKGNRRNNEIQAITGATISSSSVTRIVNRTLTELASLVKENAKK